MSRVHTHRCLQVDFNQGLDQQHTIRKRNHIKHVASHAHESAMHHVKVLSTKRAAYKSHLMSAQAKCMQSDDSESLHNVSFKQGTKKPMSGGDSPAHVAQTSN